MALPVNTIGASRPTDPPKPTVMALVIILVYIFDLRMMLDLREILYKIEVMP